MRLAMMGHLRRELSPLLQSEYQSQRVCCTRRRCKSKRNLILLRQDLPHFGGLIFDLLSDAARPDGPFGPLVGAGGAALGIDVAPLAVVGIAPARRPAI